MRKPDSKGAALRIAFNSYGWFLGHYHYVEPKAGFQRFHTLSQQFGFHRPKVVSTKVIAAYNADDVVEFDVLAYLNKWHQTTVDSETASKTLARTKERTPYAYYEIGDEILHLE